MTFADLVADLVGAGIVLWEDEGKLRFRAPRGAMTKARKAAILEYREELLQQLRDPVPTVLAEPDPAARFEPFPLTDVQSAYLLGRGEAFALGKVGCHGYGELHFDHLDISRLRRAWSLLIERHDTLRAVLDPLGQRVLRSVPDVDIPLVDVRGAAPNEVNHTLARIRSRLDHRVYQPEVWPLFELAATRTDRMSILHFSIDFLIADFVSIQLLLDELVQLHDNPATALPGLDIGFRDYLLAERRLRSGPSYLRDREYWWPRVDDLPLAPDLPIRPDHGDAPPHFRRHQVSLDQQRWSQLRILASQHGITPSVAVLTAFADVIGRWSRRRRFTLDLTLLNRFPLHPQVNQLVGDFTSVNLLEVDWRAGRTFVEQARALQATLWEDLDHRLCSGVEVMREIARRRGMAAALQPVVFTSAIGLADPVPAGRSAAPALGHGISQTPQVWIDCQNIERGGGLSSNWDVRDGVFPDGVIEDMVDAYATLLEALATAPAQWENLEPSPLPTAQRRRRDRINDTAAPLPAGCLHEPVVAQARREPDRVAVISPDRALDYGELLARAQDVAGRLRGSGCVDGDLVAVVMEKGWEQVVAVLGVLLAGAAYVPIDALQPPLRRTAMLTDAGARHVLTQHHLLDAGWPDGVTTIIVVDATPVADPVLPAGEPQPHADSLAYVIYTSGSTGSPKGVAVGHRAARNTVADISDRFGLTRADRVLGVANLGFDLSVWDIFGPLAVGGVVVLPTAHRRSDPSHWAEMIAEHGVTVWNSVPAQLQMLVDYLHATGAGAAGSLRLAMLSGDWIPLALPDRIRTQVPGITVVSLGGATEATIWSIWFPVEEVDPEWTSIPYGTPLTN
ncbi:MAG: AMP-binding protein, partial [Actinobacteria bacterium]|nr:AMP-binding protein [Actinomycetota bacterium]